jgi:hypothetical protein
MKTKKFNKNKKMQLRFFLSPKFSNNYTIYSNFLIQQINAFKNIKLQISNILLAWCKSFFYKEKFA